MNGVQTAPTFRQLDRAMNRINRRILNANRNRMRQRTGSPRDVYWTARLAGWHMAEDRLWPLYIAADNARMGR